MNIMLKFNKVSEPRKLDKNWCLHELSDVNMDPVSQLNTNSIWAMLLTCKILTQKFCEPGLSEKSVKYKKFYSHLNIVHSLAIRAQKRKMLAESCINDLIT